MTTAVEAATFSDVIRSSISLDPVTGTLLNLHLPTALSLIFYVRPCMKKRRRAKLFSSEQLEPINTGETTEYSFLKNFFMSLLL